MSKFMANWLAAAAAILRAEFAPEADLVPDAALPAEAAHFTLTVEIAGDWGGRFSASVDQSVLGALLAGIGTAGAAGETFEPLEAEAARDEWQRLFRRICVAAAADLGAKSGADCEVAGISPEKNPVGIGGISYRLRAGDAMVALTLFDQVVLRDQRETAATKTVGAAATPLASGAAPEREVAEAEADAAAERSAAPAIEMKGMELLLDVELEASLRFGSREMALCDLLALGPGDVIQLDRALADPVDLIIGDKIVARGEVVLVNGNFGLQIAEVAEPRKSLESIRCLF